MLTSLGDRSFNLVIMSTEWNTDVVNAFVKYGLISQNIQDSLQGIAQLVSVSLNIGRNELTDLATRIEQGIPAFFADLPNEIIYLIMCLAQGFMNEGGEMREMKLSDLAAEKVVKRNLCKLESQADPDNNLQADCIAFLKSYLDSVRGNDIADDHRSAALVLLLFFTHAATDTGCCT